jgi:hypothetical protein
MVLLLGSRFSVLGSSYIVVLVFPVSPVLPVVNYWLKCCEAGVE